MIEQKTESWTGSQPISRPHKRGWMFRESL